MKENKAVMSIKEVAQFLGLHPFTVQKYAREGRIPAFKIGSEWKFEKRHIQRWLKEKTSFKVNKENNLF